MLWDKKEKEKKNIWAYWSAFFFYSHKQKKWMLLETYLYILLVIFQQRGLKKMFTHIGYESFHSPSWVPRILKIIIAFDFVAVNIMCLQTKLCICSKLKHWMNSYQLTDCYLTKSTHLASHLIFKQCILFPDWESSIPLILGCIFLCAKPIKLLLSSDCLQAVDQIWKRLVPGVDWFVRRRLCFALAH